MRQVVVFILLLLPLTVFAQRVKTVEGEYTYHAPENVTIEQAKRTALERAKIQALADEFAKEQASAANAAVNGLVDGIVDASQLRSAVVDALAMMSGKRISRLPKKHSNIQL